MIDADVVVGGRHAYRQDPIRSGPTDRRVRADGDLLVRGAGLAGGEGSLRLLVGVLHWRAGRTTAPAFLRGRAGARVGQEPLHFDINPRGCDQATELKRLISLGARQIDIGQGDVPWIVLADPEGNEFCLLGRRLD